MKMRRLREILQHPFFPFLFLGGFYLLLHIIIEPNFGDELLFPELIRESGKSILGFALSRYDTWSSRTLIEIVLFYVIKSTVLWKVLDTGMMILIALVLSKLCYYSYYRSGFLFREETKEELARGNRMVVAVCLLYPFYHMNTAGWIATTVNYFWPLALGLVALYPLIKIIHKDSIKWWQFPVYSLALLFAGNLEQMSLLITGYYAVFLLYFLVKEKRVSPYLIFQMVLGFASIVYIIRAKGNNIRYQSEVKTWLPEFDKLSSFRKLELGFSSTMHHFLMKNDLIFVLLCAFLTILICIKYKSIVKRWMAVTGLLITLVLGIGKGMTQDIFPGLSNIPSSITEYGSGIMLTSVKSWVPDGIMLLACVSIVMTLYFVFDSRKKALFGVLLFLSGLMSRIVMGFSPTIWGSGERTFLFQYFTILIILLLLAEELLEWSVKQKKNSYGRSLEQILYGAAALSMINLLYYMN